MPDHIVFAHQISELIKLGYRITDPRGDDVTDAMREKAIRDVNEYEERFPIHFK